MRTPASEDSNTVSLLEQSIAPPTGSAQTDGALLRSFDARIDEDDASVNQSWQKAIAIARPTLLQVQRLNPVVGPQANAAMEVVADKARWYAEHSYARSTLRNYSVWWRLVLELCEQWSVSPLPMSVDRPTARRCEIVPLNPAQVEAFLEAAERDPYNTLFLLAFNSGMRQGELFGLKPRDVDYVNNLLSVQRAVIATRAGYKDAPEGISDDLDTLVVVRPKKDKRRTIKLPRFVMEMLRQHAKGLARQGQFEWLFTNKAGGFIWASGFNRNHFQKIKKAADKQLPADNKLPPGFRFHDIRHTHATTLLMDGVDTKIVSERLGHSSPAFTAATYQHILPPMQDKAADAIDKRGFGKVDKKVKKIRRKPAA